MITTAENTLYYRIYFILFYFMYLGGIVAR